MVPTVTDHSEVEQIPGSEQIPGQFNNMGQKNSDDFKYLDIKSQDPKFLTKYERDFETMFEVEEEGIDIGVVQNPGSRDLPSNQSELLINYNPAQFGQPGIGHQPGIDPPAKTIRSDHAALDASLPGSHWCPAHGYGDGLPCCSMANPTTDVA